MTPSPRPGGVRQVAAHGLVYVAGTALQGLGVLLVTPFVTRTLSRGEFGRVSASLVAIQLVGTVAAAGLPQVILREFHRRQDGGRGARALVGTMFLGALGLAVFTGLGVAALAAMERGPDLGLPLLVVLGAAALTGVVAGQALMRAQGRPWHFLAMALFSTVAAQGAGLLAARASPTAESFLIAYVSALAMAALGSALLTRPRWPLRERAAVARGLRLAVPLLPHAVAMLVLLMGDVLVVAFTLGSEAVATYQVALLLGNMPFVLVTALVNAWAPAVLGREAADRWPWARRTGLALAVLVALGGIAVALLGPWLGAVAAPASFDLRRVVVLVALMASVAPAYLLYNGSSLALIDAAATGRLAWAAVTAAGALVLLAWMGALTGGLEGVASARLGGYVLLSLLTARLASRHGLRWPAKASLGLAALTGTLGVGAGALLPGSGPGALWRPVLLLLLGVAAALVARRLLVQWRQQTASRIATGDQPSPR